MTLGPGRLLSLAFETVQSPRPVYARLRGLDLPRAALWESLLLVVVVSVLLAEIGNLILLSTIADTSDAPRFLSPFTFGAIQFSILVISVFLIDVVGRAMGGRGDMNGAILAMVWLQFIMIVLQLAQTVLLLVMPGLAALVLLAGLVLFLYLMTAFITELHGFDSMGRVFAMILFVTMGVALGLSFILTLIGVTVPR